MNYKYCTILLCLVALALTGCDGGKKQISGKVTFSDGKPVTLGKVVFSTESFQATGTIQEDGSYRMGTIGEKDGVPPGEYSVSVMGVARLDLGAMTSYPLCEEKYMSPQTSGLTITIPVPGNKYDIVLEPHPKYYP